MADQYRVIGDTNTRTQYSSLVGLVFLFNLIVGTGALAIPKAFGNAGWLAGTIIISVLAVFSYITSTFVIETMACMNALKRVGCRRKQNMSDVFAHEVMSVNGQQQQQDDDSLENSSNSETTPLNSHAVIRSPEDFEISDAIEMGDMAAKLFNRGFLRVGQVIFYICIVVYLYGDLAIYAVAVPETLRDVACESFTHPLSNGSSNYSDSDICWTSSHLSRIDVYRVFLAIFAAFMGPLVFLNLSKTKLLQIFTVVLRWLSFLLMIILTIVRLSSGGGEGHPAVVDISGMTNLLGASVYAFMCHHSLPQMATPIRNKSNIYRLFGVDFLIILVFYVTICITAVFTFSDIQDLYTLNFGPKEALSVKNPITKCVVIQYFLALFPVFTLCSSFPIIGITLRNNLKVLFMLLFHRADVPFPWPVDRLLFPLLAVAVPFIVAFATTNVQFLVGITGSYAGSGIQYIFPATFVFLARRQVIEINGAAVNNPYRSPFRHTFWVITIFVWAAICIIFVTANHILSSLHVE